MGTRNYHFFNWPYNYFNHKKLHSNNYVKYLFNVKLIKKKNMHLSTGKNIYTPAGDVLNLQGDKNMANNKIVGRGCLFG